MKTSVIEMSSIVAMAFAMLYVMFFAVKIVDHDNKCMAAIIADLLSGNVSTSQVVCYPEKK